MKLGERSLDLLGRCRVALVCAEMIPEDLQITRWLYLARRAAGWHLGYGAIQLEIDLHKAFQDLILCLRSWSNGDAEGCEECVAGARDENRYAGLGLSMAYECLERAEHGGGSPGVAAVPPEYIGEGRIHVSVRCGPALVASPAGPAGTTSTLLMQAMLSMSQKVT